jgi:hypothetical protein
VLLLELAWTRILSFQLPWTAVYPALGLAKLGLALGALAAARRPGRWLGACAPLGGLSAAAAYLLLARDPAGFASLDPQRVPAAVATAAGLLALPQLALGALAAGWVERVGARSGLASIGVGLALGCVLGAPLLALLEPPACAVLAGGLLALAGVARGGAGRAAAAVALALAGAALWPALLPPPASRAARDPLIAGAAPERSHWGARLRIDVYRVDLGGVPLAAVFHDGAQVEVRRLFDDAGESARALAAEPVSLPYRALESAPRRSALLGVGLERALEAALHFGAGRIDAVTPLAEEAARIRRGLEQTHAADVRARVALDAEEPPGFLAGADAGYDLVILRVPASRAVQHAATAAPYLLAEASWLTRETLGCALRLLGEQGWLAVELFEADFEARPQAAATLVATLREAAERLGMRDFARHVMVATSGGFGDFVSVLVKRSPIADAEAARLLAAVAALPRGSARFAAGHVFHAGPVAEVLLRPRRSPASRRSDAEGVRGLDAGWPFLSSFGDGLGAPLPPARRPDPLLVFWLGAALLAAGAGVAGAGLSGRRGAPPGGLRRAAALAAAGVGAACHQIWLVQRLAPLLGAPTRSLAIALAALAAGLALGAVLAPVCGRRIRVWLWPALLMAWTLAAPAALGALDARSPALLRGACAVAAALPLGALLGMLAARLLSRPALPVADAAAAQRAPREAAPAPQRAPREAAPAPRPVPGVAAGVAALAFGAALGPPLAAVLALAWGLGAALAAGLVAWGAAGALGVRLPR